MVNGMANRETSELGGEGVAVYPEGLISWVFTPELRERGVMVMGGAVFSLETYFCRTVTMRGKHLCN